MYYWSQVYAVAPYLKNDAYIKYALSSQAYGDLLVSAGDPCEAKVYFEQSLLAWENGTLVPTATEAYGQCEEVGEVEETPTEETPAPQGGLPTETPTPDGGGGGSGSGG